MITMSHISMRFGRFTALNDVSLRVGAGEAVALWGPNGAGKTTLVRCVLGLLPFKGTASVGDLDVRRKGKSARRLIGYVPQEPAIFDDLRVAEVATLFARLKGASTADAKRALESAGIASHARKRVRELSGGMKQRLSLALALVTDPPALILDEPTSNLDAEARNELITDIASLRDAGKAVLFISHRTEDVKGIADRIVTLESGKIVKVDSPGTDDSGPIPARLLIDKSELIPALSALRHVGVHAKQECNSTCNGSCHGNKQAAQGSHEQGATP